MDRRRVIALLSLGIVSAGVGGIAVSFGGDNSSESAAADGPLPTLRPDAVARAGESVDEARRSEASAPVDVEPVVDPNVPELPDRGPHPEFLPVQEWLQTDTPDFSSFDGKVRAVQFWTFGCSNCQATWPHMRDLHAEYEGADFGIIGVHAPEFDFERDVDSIAAAAADNGLVWPIAIDNEKLNFRSWQERRFWPRLFLLDADGNIRYDHIGEGRYDEIDAAVGALIDEKNA